MIETHGMLIMPLAQGFELPAASTVIGWIVFGSIGTIAVAYGKLRESWPPAVIGFALMLYPYVFPSGFSFWLTGCLLSILLVLPSRIRGF
ncbi:hypothetical protein [Haloferula sp.]|uniref:hypothetical protein n=1 Tax=Haloferula sp. TaxID=2497595 RepID=UPI003C754250